MHLLNQRKEQQMKLELSAKNQLLKSR